MYKNLYNALACILGTLFLVGCGTAQTVSTFSHPAVAGKDNSRVYSASTDKVWDATIHSLSNNFVVENANRPSGIMTVAYTLSDPMLYVDCGTRTITNKAQGKESVTTFPYAQKYVEILVADGTTQLKPATRSTTLSGRMNIIFLPIESNKVNVTVNTHYDLKVNLKGTRYVPTGMFFGYNQDYTDEEVISFNNAEVGYDRYGESRCVSKSTLEKLVLDNIANQLR